MKQRASHLLVSHIYDEKKELPPRMRPSWIKSRHPFFRGS